MASAASPAGAGPVKLYKHGPGWSMPTFDPACLQVEVYLRLARIPFVEQVCQSVEQSPTGRLPAIEDGEELVIDNEERLGIIYHLQDTRQDLNAGLAPSELAEVQAFLTLVETTLTPAVLAAVWVESSNYPTTRLGYSGMLPFPLSRIVPLGKRADITKALKQSTHKDIDELYKCAEKTYRTLAAKLGEHKYLVGGRPTSLDAAVFAHVLFITRAPLPKNPLKDGLPPLLERYAARLEPEVFASQPLPPPPPVPSAPAASRVMDAVTQRTAGVFTDIYKWWNKPKTYRPAKEERFRRRSRYAVVFALASAVVYVLMGDMIQFQDMEDDYEDAGDDIQDDDE
eukprot:jgi/Chlat1/8949/Chrsp94S08257